MQSLGYRNPERHRPALVRRVVVSVLVVYRVDPKSGELSEIQRMPAGGDRQWGFGIDPSGKWMLVANQHSGNMSVFNIDPSSGRLASTGESIAMPTPVSVAFVKRGSIGPSLHFS